MSSIKRYSQDYYGGGLVMLIGLVCAYGGAQYHIGTLRHMGPGFFPTSIGIILTLIGLLIAANARPAATQPAEKPRKRAVDVRGALCILGGLASFMVLGNYGGLVPATFAVVFISAMGDRQNTVLKAAALAAAMVITAVLLFWWALQIQISLFAWG